MAPGQSKAVFVGNIPFNLSEEQIIGILSQAGTVTKFRLMTNPDTGKPKGFGFADYADADSAASAVRNLNDHEVNGRKIRVDWPHNNDKDAVPQNYDQTAGAAIGADGANGVSSTTLPPLPAGTDLPPNLKATDSISQTLSMLAPQQLLDVLTQMKSLAISEPQRATELLKSAPQLAYAIFQALILMNLVDPTVLAQVVEQATPRPPQSQPQSQPPPMNVPQPQNTAQQYSGFPPPPMPGQPQQPPPPQQQQQQQLGMAPRPQQAYGMPAQPPQAQPTPTPQPPPQMSQEEMLRQVLAMDQRTIDTLPPNERAQIMALRQQMGVR